jgi:alkylation response protein AidB-like acyl-CoA dehydrogenase
MVFPTAEVSIMDTWHALGLRGTNSNDVRVRSFCPDARTASIVGGPPTIDRPAYRVPGVEYGGLLIAAVAVGIAAGAVDDIVGVAAGGKRPAFETRRLHESELYADRVGEAYLAVQGARSLLASQAAIAWNAAVTGSAGDAVTAATVRATATAVMGAARSAVEAAYALGGGTSVFDGSALQQRLRDMQTATQHAAAGRHTYVALGRALTDRSQPPA